MSETRYDAVIVGAGVVGALVAKVLTEAGRRVLILEAGRATGLGNDYAAYEAYRSYVEYYQTQLVKIPNSPYPPNASAPSPYATDSTAITPAVPDTTGYWVQRGPDPFMSSYLRQQGGTTLHWMSECPRLLPDDFRIRERYRVGQDWPLTYEDLSADYCAAEWEMGVAGNRVDQEFLGISFPEGYDYPMQGLPDSYLDGRLKAKVDGKPVPFDGGELPVHMYNLPTARNSTPRRFPGATSPPDGAPPWDGYQPRGAVGAPEIGQRCEGNSSCTPICPVQAKYSALKTLNRLDAARCTLWTQAVASWLELDANGRIARLHVKRYDAEGGPATDVTVEATLFVLAAHAVENAKILLASGPPNQRAGGLANSSGQVGRNLMDHPYFLTWALAPESMGSFRGPGYTSGVWSFMNGAFREHQAAFRIDIGNWGWNFATNSPYSDVLGLMQQNVFGSRLRTTLGDTVPRQIRFGFQLEQLPEWRNQVTIDDNYRDALGQYRPVITYGLSDYTWRAMASAVRVSHAMFDYLGVAPHERFHLGQTGSPTAGLPTAREFEGLGLAFYGAGHLVGTHRMGSSPAESVVNAAQQSWDHDNLYVVGCGSQPTIGCANPTLTAAALALRSARDMLTRLR